MRLAIASVSAVEGITWGIVPSPWSRVRFCTKCGLIRIFFWSAS